MAHEPLRRLGSAAQPGCIASVIKIASPRRTTYDAKGFGSTKLKEVPMKLRERVHTRPIECGPGVERLVADVLLADIPAPQPAVERTRRRRTWRKRR
jgi:hypothetical protein